MPEEVVAPQVEAPVTPEVKVEAPKVEEQKPDLLKRVTSFKPVEQPKPATNEFGLTQEDYEKVKTDPTLSKFYKSLEAGAGKKFQEAAEIRKNAEAKLAEISNWTPERVQQLLNDKNFVASAQRVAEQIAPQNSGLSNEQWSALSDSDKAKFAALELKTNQMEQLLQRERQSKEDESLKNKYADYKPDIVDTTISKLLNGEYRASREDIWKVINHDTNVEKAYKLGLQDASLEIKDKVGASSFTGTSTTTPSEKIEPNKGESNREFFRRIVMNNMLKNKK